MNRRYKRRTNSTKLKEIFTSHIENNLKEYIIVGLIFFIGIIIGIIFINKASDGQKEEIITYISSFATDLKENQSVNEMALLLNSLKKNLLLAIFLWFMGSTVIGISIVYLIICFRGFSLGYTISSIILTFGTRKRYFISNFDNFDAKYFIHSMHINACCKWNENS
ncbi:MAG: stage II sporulation protein M [Clostridia bacterium]|nr:stage II sporulation protein M [Clostridia bacterium]